MAANIQNTWENGNSNSTKAKLHGRLELKCEWFKSTSGVSKVLKVTSTWCQRHSTRATLEATKKKIAATFHAVSLRKTENKHTLRMHGIHIWLIFMVNVGEYTSPMDPTGYTTWLPSSCGLESFKSIFQAQIHVRTCISSKDSDQAGRYTKGNPLLKKNTQMQTKSQSSTNTIARNVCFVDTQNASTCSFGQLQNWGSLSPS